MRTYLSRRKALVGVAATGACGLAGVALIKPGLAAKLATAVKLGEYLWHPERASDGPVTIVVSIPDQLVHVYRNGIQIGLSTCSTGKPGHATPTGVFTVLQKDKYHHSSTYNNAAMPNMNRLTWSGVALHAGNLPGYPASHGCIRLPLEFSALLFGVTHLGTPVIVADDHSQPAEITHSGTILSALADDEMATAVAKLAYRKLPPQERHADMQHAVSVLVSRADRELYIIKNSDIVTKAGVDIERPDDPLGSHVFVLVGAHEASRSLRWHAVGYNPGSSDARLAPSDIKVIGRVQSDPTIARGVADLMHPGLVLVLTDHPARPDTRSNRNFVVMTQDT